MKLAGDLSSMSPPLFVASFVLLLGTPIIFALVPSARRFFLRSRAAQAISAFAIFLLLGLALPRSVALALMFMAWLTYLFGSRRREKWAYALWLPLSTASLLAAGLWLGVLNTAFSAEPGFAKVGAALLFRLFMPAPVVLLISLCAWPREPDLVRPQSLACGISFVIGFTFVTACEFMARL